MKLTRFHELHLPQHSQQISICLKEREKECSHFSQQEVLHFTKTIKKNSKRTPWDPSVCFYNPLSSKQCLITSPSASKTEKYFQNWISFDPFCNPIVRFCLVPIFQYCACALDEMRTMSLMNCCAFEISR